MSESSRASDLPSVLTVATLTKTHGIRGELKIRCTPEHLAFLREVAEHAEPVTLRIPDTGDEYEVTFASIRGHESAPIVAIDGVDDRSGAEAFRGALVCVPRELLPEPDEDEYFLADLVGCIVYDSATDAPIGTVETADALPANVVLTIARTEGDNFLAPLAGDAVPFVDVEARRITVDTAFLGLDVVDEDDEGREDRDA
ncbi:MAG: ribosome maturation factor RimM [Gaiellales bacterium]